VPCSLRTQTCTCKRCQYRRRIHVVDSCHRKHVETDCSHDSRVLSTSLTSSSAVTTRPQRYHIIIMPPLRRGAGALSGDRRPSSVCLSVCLSDVAYIGYNSKTKRPRKTKLCTGVPQVTCDSHTDFKVKTSKVKVTGGAYCGGHLAAQLVIQAVWPPAGFGRHGISRPSVTVTSDRLTLKLVCESHLMWRTFISNLGVLSIWVLELFAMFATDGQTDRRTKATFMPLPYGRGQNKHFYGTRQNVSNEMEFVSPADCSDKVDNSAESTH